MAAELGYDSLSLSKQRAASKQDGADCVLAACHQPAGIGSEWNIRHKDKDMDTKAGVHSAKEKRKRERQEERMGEAL